MKVRLLRPGTLAAMALPLAILSAPAQAQDKKLDAQRIYNISLAATCANCHGTNGVSVAADSIPHINNLTQSQIEEKLRAYKDGSAPGTIMPQLAKGYTDEQIKIVAEVLGKKN